MASQTFQGLLNKPLDFGSTVPAQSAQIGGNINIPGTPFLPGQPHGGGGATTPSFGAMSDTPVPFTSPSGGGAPRAIGSGDSQGRGGDPSNPLTYLKAVAAHGDLNPKQREEYERLLREEQNRMRPAGIPTMPSAPAPVLPPAQTSVIRPPSGATALVPSVSQGTQAGAMAFGAPTQQGLATQALQAKGFVMPTPTPTPAPTQEEQKQFQIWAHQEKIDPQFVKQPGFIENLMGLAARSGAFGPGAQLPSTLSQALPKVSAAFEPTMAQFLQLIRGTKQGAGMEQAKQPEITVEKQKGLAATPQNILGSQDQGIVKQALQEHITGKSKISTSDLIAGIASKEALPTINKEMDKAQKSGDMEVVQRLANIYTGVQRQIQFNDILQQAIFAIASGMGTPQAARVTATRLPMVQQAAGTQLEAPPTPQAGIPQQQEGVPISYLPPRFPQEDQTQRNKPPIYPWMTGA